jgi:hypothetical protein
MDMLLCQRDNNPVRFYGYSRKDILTMVRATVRLEAGVPKAPPILEVNDKELIRADVGRILRAASLHNYADLVDFTNEKYTSYRWADRNRLGRANAHTSDWSNDKFREFSSDGKSRQTW